MQREGGALLFQMARPGGVRRVRALMGSHVTTRPINDYAKDAHANDAG
jgi:hypothetical protein